MRYGSHPDEQARRDKAINKQNGWGGGGGEAGIAQNEGSRQMTQLGYANFDVIMYNEYSKGLNSSVSILFTH